MRVSRLGVSLAFTCVLCGSVMAATSNPWVLKATLSAPGNPLEFGYSVGISGNTIAATANDSIGVYVEPKAGWSNLSTPTAKLTASDGAVFSSVAICGNTIVAGSVQDGGTGAAYVFVEPSGGWKNMNETAKLTAADAASGDFVGTSVAISGNTIVVGADQNNSVGASFPPPEPNGAGAAYVFVKPSAGWSNMTETAKLTASDGAAGDDFAYSVSILGNTIVASSPNATIGTTNLEGAAYIFEKSGSQWKNSTESAKLTASDGHSVTLLGMGLSISGNTLAAAAFDKVYLFFKPAGGWSTGTQNVELSSTSYTFFGLNSVAIYEGNVLAGSPYDNVPFADLYVEPAAGWKNMTPTYRLKAPAKNGNGSDGWSVAMNATTLVVSSPLFGGNGGNVVYVYGKN
ncbi:MAG: FG-GAP repeat protein [Candidatus Sulfotelmatobacter sp.]|jgi:hypothetical protein